MNIGAASLLSMNGEWMYSAHCYDCGWSVENVRERVADRLAAQHHEEPHDDDEAHQPVVVLY